MLKFSWSLLTKVNKLWSFIFIFEGTNENCDIELTLQTISLEKIKKFSHLYITVKWIKYFKKKEIMIKFETKK
jgi:hypothetical protein